MYCAAFTGKDSQIIADAARQCGAIYFIMRSLSPREDGYAELVNRLNEIMDDLYMTHSASLHDGFSTKAEMIKIKDKAVSRLVRKYNNDPVSVTDNVYWCDDWSTSLEKHFVKTGSFENKNAMVLAAPLPPPRNTFDDIENSDIGKLVDAAFKSWTSRGSITPLEEYYRIVIDQIARECLNAWPSNLLEKLAGVRVVPHDIEADPSLQSTFFRKHAKREKGLFYPTQLDEILQPFKEYVGPGKRFLDLGSGDGRVVFLANVLGADANGIEIDTDLFKTSRIAMQKLDGILQSERLQLLHGDFFNVPWSGYDVVFYFGLGSSEEQRIRMKLDAEMDPEALLIINRYADPFLDMELVREFHSVKIFRKTRK